METVVLEKTIIKLGSLLALGFGEAGANIINHNLKCSDSAGVNVMVPGTKVDCILGKARICDFSTATEVLKGKVMAFVNQIAEIVHGVVDEFGGAPNKNTGDTFFLLWRISGLDDVKLSKNADMSMMAFAKILCAVHRAPFLAEYRTHPGLQQRLGSHTRVRLSFGLHAGWAIEGAVGSEFKIDASYLSPNVSIASSVEMATSVYNVPIIVSHTVVQLSNIGMAKKCRLVDRVIIKGSSLPLMLYSLDVDYDALKVDTFTMQAMGIDWNTRQRFKARQFLEGEKARKMSEEVKMVKEFDNCKDLVLMRLRYNTTFLQQFHMGYQNYSHGEWQVARRFLSESRIMLHGHHDDGPSVALLHFMEQHDFEAPDGWIGVRDLPISQSLPS
jgi:class 3 adenylate cyclase